MSSSTGVEAEGEETQRGGTRVQKGVLMIASFDRHFSPTFRTIHGRQAGRGVWRVWSAA